MSNQRHLPRGLFKLVAHEVALDLLTEVQKIELHKPGLAHMRDQLYRAADNMTLRLSEASGRTMGNRRQHLEGAYGECQEAKSALEQIRKHGVEVPETVDQMADRLGGLLYGLLRAERRKNQT